MTTFLTALKNQAAKDNEHAWTPTKGQVVALSRVIAKVFWPVHSAIRNGTKSEFFLKGGRGSTKSSFVAIEIIQGIIDDPKANAVVVRKVADTIRNSVLATLEWAIEALGVTDSFRVTTSPAEITYIPTGQKILFRGLDDPKKLKSIRIKKGYFKFLWFEEGQEYKNMAEIRSVEQSVKRGGPAFVEFITFNPPPEPKHWINVEAARPKKDKYGNNIRMVHHSCYTDIPPEWLGDVFLQDAAALMEADLIAYQNEYLGMMVGKTEAIIFAGKCVVRDFQVQPNWHGPYYGADWGFANDPNALVKCWIEDVPGGEPSQVIGANGKPVPMPVRQRLYVEYDEFGYQTELDDLPAFFDRVPGSRQHKIRADSARPETISHMKKRGFKVEGAEKWKGSVEDGITVLKSFVEIVLHPRCKNLENEATMYRYKVDKLTGDVLPDIIDLFNHGWDAVRYALADIIKPKKKGFFS